MNRAQVFWRFSRALYRADQRTPARNLEPLIDEDVEWVIHEPIIVSRYRRKPRMAAVIEVSRHVRKTGRRAS